MLTTVAEDGAGQLRFSLFGVPVAIDASFLILLLIVALPALDEGPGVAVGLAAIVFTSVLGHELGHAAAIQALVEPNPSIMLYGLGGLTRHTKVSSRPRDLIVSLSGPAAGLLVGFAALVAGHLAGGEAEDLGQLGWELALFWTVANLLPVLPLDGGQALRNALPGSARARHRMVLVVSVITCTAGGLVAWRWGDPILVVFAAWFGITNLLELRNLRGGGGSIASLAEELPRLQEGFAHLRPETAAALEEEARDVLSHAPEEARVYVGTVLVAALLVQDEYVDARDLVGALGPHGCAHGLVQLLDLGPEAGVALEERIRSRSSAYDATLYLLDRSLHHDWERAGMLVEERPPESFEADWLELCTSWAFHAGAFEAAGRLGRVLEARVNGPAPSYNVACSAARAGDVSGAFAALDRAVERGWNDLATLDADDDLAVLHSSPDWERIRQRVRLGRSSGGESTRRWGAAAGLAVTLAVTALSIRLGSAAEEPAPTFADGGPSITSELVATDPSTGQELWRYSGSMMYPSWVDDDLVILEEIGVGAVGLDAATGAERWRSDVSGHPVGVADVVVLNEVGDAEEEAPVDPRVVVLDRETGEVLWSREDAAAITVLEDVVVLNPSRRGQTIGVDAATGTERWSVPGRTSGLSADVTSTLVVADAERLTGVDARSGAARWTMLGDLVGTSAEAAWVRRAGEPRIQRVDLGSGAVAPVSGVTDVESVVGDDGGVAVLWDGSRHWGVDERSGAVRWEREGVDDDLDQPMAVGGGLGIETAADTVTAVDLRTGEVRWQAEVSEVLYARQQADVVVASTPEGSVVLDADSGEQRRRLLADRGASLTGTDHLLLFVEYHP